jgi:hypothetical protein
MGFYHEYLGLPDNVRMKNLPNGDLRAAPNWNPFDINIGPIIFAIEQIQTNRIGKWYMQDPAIESAFQKLKESFSF